MCTVVLVCALSLQEKKLGHSLCVLISVSIMAQCNHEESPPTLQPHYSIMSVQLSPLLLHFITIWCWLLWVRLHNMRNIHLLLWKCCPVVIPHLWSFSSLSHNYEASSLHLFSVFPPSVVPSLIYHSPSCKSSLSPDLSILFFRLRGILKPN